PPEPRDPDGAGYGPDHFHSPVLRLGRRDINGRLYAGQGVGDTLTTFPINAQGQTRMVLTFDFMRGGKQLYPTLWDAQTLAGPEQTIVTTGGKVVRAGDSLLLEFKDHSDRDCNPTKWNEIAAIDGGHDLEFQSFWMMMTADSSARYRINGGEEH